MITKIYKEYSEFLKRNNKDENGVSEEFAQKHENYEKQNETNKGCYDCYGCSRCSDCYDCYGCSRCSDCYDCSDCSDCYGCYGCSRCSRCSDCYDCYDCSGETDKKEKKEEKAEENLLLNPPKIEKIHTAVYQAASKPNAFDMSKWHTCDTTHCRAGWVVTLAGEKGKALEAKTSTLFAAMMIYKNSSTIKVSPPRFFEKNDVAMDDMKKCAEQESS